MFLPYTLAPSCAPIAMLGTVGNFLKERLQKCFRCAYYTGHGHWDDVCLQAQEDLYHVPSQIKERDS